MEDQDKDLLLKFIHDEENALSHKDQGKLWPSNHGKIAKLVSQAANWLTVEQRTQFYFHLLRVSSQIPAVSEDEFPHLVAAYRRLLYMDHFVWYLAKRHKLLFCFGFDLSGPLPEGETRSAQELQNYNKLLTKLDQYSHLPGQREKTEKLLAYTIYSERIYETLRHLGYRHDFPVSTGDPSFWNKLTQHFSKAAPDNNRDEPYRVTDLTFWGMVLIALLSKPVRGKFLDDFLNGSFDIPKKDEHWAILHQTVQAVLPYGDEDETQFHRLAQQLSDFDRDRKSKTESYAWAQALSLPFKDDEEWTIAIMLQDNDPKKRNNSLILQIGSDPDCQWTIKIDSQESRFLETSDRMMRNDLAIKGLGQGNLNNFPAWVRSVNEALGKPYILEDARILPRANQSTVKPIKHWLTAG